MDKGKKKNLSIRKLIIIAYLVGIIVPILVIGYTVFANWISSTSEITKSLSEDMNHEIANKINSFLNIPLHVNQVNEMLIKNRIIDLSNEVEREKYFVGVLNAHEKSIYSFTFGEENGEYYGARRNENGETEIVRNNGDTSGSSWYYSVKDDLTRDELIMKTDPFDVRTRDWYKAAIEAKTTTFSPVYKHFVKEDLTISAATPIYNSDGELEGVLGTHMILSDINQYMKDMVKDVDGFIVVMENNSNLLIANSFGSDNFAISDDGKLQRYTASELDNPLIDVIQKQYAVNEEESFQAEGSNGSYYVQVTHYKNLGIDWIIVSAVSSKMYSEKIYNSMKVTILVMFITIFIAILVYYFIIKNIFKPIYDLVVTSSEIASGNLLRRADIVRNDEIGNLSYAFNYMADRLYEFVENLEVKVKERTTKLESANEELLETKEDLQLILDSTAEGIVGIDMEGRSIFCNDSCIRLLGYHSQEEILGKNIYHVFFQNHGVESHNGVEYPILRALRTGKYLYVDDAAFVRPDGSKLPVEYHSYPKRKEGSVIGAVITFFDTSEKHENQKQIEYLSYHDALTGLMNRRFFEHKLKQLNQEGILPISIIFGDLNGLKLVNDIFGHAAGDKLIVKSAKAIERVCSEKHMVARVGGDEFIVILPGEDEVSTMKIIQRIRDELAKEKIFAVKCSMSLGFDTKRELSQDLEKIVGNAESEMYKEKLINKKSFGQDAIQTMIQEVQSKNPGEAEHSERVAYLCQEMGKAMGLSERDIRRLKDAGYIHDIGKIALEKDIFNSDHLSEAQLEQIRQHPSVGFKILNLFDDTLDLAETVYAHHERWDGTGYPKGLKGEEIPITARVIAIVGKYERMYRTKYFNEKNAKELALSEIKALSGAAFDPDLVVVFSAMMEASEDLK